MTNETKRYDLEERTTKFGQNIVGFAKKISLNSVTERIIPQLVGSGTSIGANYCEADDAESRNDFKHKIGIAKKEARECKYWLRIIGSSFPELAPEARVLWQEVKELHLILNAIVHSTKNNIN